MWWVLQRIPANVRDFSPSFLTVFACFWYRDNVSWDQAQTPVSTVFSAGLKKHLHPKTNAEHRPARRSDFDQSLVQAAQS
jgi:hypothetical protein